MNGQRLDVLYYELELRTSQYDEQINHIDQRLRTLTDSAPHVVQIGADTSGAVKEFQRLASSAAIATSAMLAVAGGALKIADDLKAAEGRLKLVTDSTEDLIVVQERLGVIANDTFASYAVTADLFARVARSTRALKVSQEELLAVTEAINTAARLSNASTAATEAGLMQLGQAFAAGALRAEELNSVLEQLPRLAEAIADGLGIPIGKLRELGAAGALTSAQVFDALRSQLAALQEEAAKLPPTIGQAFVIFQNEMGRYIAGANEATGATGALARMIVGAADHLEALALVATVAGATFIGKAIGPMLQKGGELLAMQVRQATTSTEAAKAKVRETAAALENAQAQHAATRARLQDIEATQRAIVVERQLAAARLQAANARLATATSALANPAASGMAFTEAQAGQVAAQQNVSRAMTDLARLGEQQARVTKELTAATLTANVANQAVAVSTRAHATALAATTMAARLGTIAMRGWSLAIGLLGGPIGAAITATIMGISYALHRKAKATAEAREQTEKLRASLEAMSAAEIRAELGKLEGRRIAILLERQQPGNANPNAQNQLSIEDAAIRDRMASLYGQFGTLEQRAKDAAKVIRSELATSAQTAEAALTELQKGGLNAADAFEEAASRWKDRSDANRTFVDALNAGDKAAKDLLDETRKTIDAQRRLQDGKQALRDALTKETRATEELARAQERARDQLASLLAKHEDVAPITKSREAIAAWKTEAEAARLSPYQIAEGLDRLNAALALKNADNLTDLEQDLAELAAEASGDALALLDLAYDKIIQQITKKVALTQEEQRAAEALGDTERALRAVAMGEGFRAQLALREQERDKLKEIERLAQRAAEARKIEVAFAKSADATYRGQTATIADLRRSESELLAVRTALQAIVDDPKASPKARAEAQQQINALLKDEAEQTETIGTKTETAAQATVKVGDGIRNAAQHALTLVQLLGDGNTELARMLSGVITLGDGISKLGEAATAAGGFSKLFSSGSKAASAAGPIAAIAAGTVALFSAISGTNEEAKRRAAELKAAGETFAKNLGAFVRAIAEESVGAFAEARNRLAEEIGGLVADAAKGAGLDDSGLRGGRQSAASIRAELARIEADNLRLQEILATGSGKQLQEAVRALAANLAYAEGLKKVAAAAEDGERALKARQAQEIAHAKDDLEVRRLRAAGDEAGARALEEQRAAQHEVNAAIEDFAGEGALEYVRALREVTEAELKAAAAARERTAAISELDDRETLSGDDLTRVAATGAKLWPEVFNAIFSDLDLSTEAGLQEAKQRIREWYERIAADGIDEAERPMVDFILRMFGGITKALDAFRDPIDQAIEAFDVQAKTFGFTAAQQVQGLGVLLSAKTPGLADILGSTFQDEVLTPEGRERLKAQLQAGISSILADGAITDAERPLLEALQQLLALVLQSIEEAATEADDALRQAEANAQAREQARQEGLGRRARSASTRIALDDLDGADALQATFGGFSEALGAFFATFDLSSLDGIDRATAGLLDVYAALEGMTDDEILAKWGMTRDEVTDALLQVESGLDGLGESLNQLAKEQGDFVHSIEVDFLKAIGRGLDAVILETELWVESMIATAKALGVWTEEIDAQIRTIGKSRIEAEQQKDSAAPTWQQMVANATASAVANVTRAVASGQLAPDPSLLPDTPAPTQRDEFVASDITRLSTTEALRMTDYLSMIQVDQRGSRRALEDIVGLLSTMSAGGLPPLSVPRLPSNFGSAGSGSQIVFAPTITGDVYGMDADDVAEAIAKKVFPYINRLLYQDALREARNAGRSSLS